MRGSVRILSVSLVVALAAKAEAQCVAADASWQSVSSTGPNSAVFALSSNGAALAVAGDFTHVGSLQVNSIAVLSGSSWSARSGGTGGTLYDVRLRASGHLTVVGSFSDIGRGLHNLAVWSPPLPAWSSPSSGTDSQVNRMQDWRDSIAFTGLFNVLGQVEAIRIGISTPEQWEALGDGLDGPGYGLCVWGSNEDLIAVGDFETAGGVAADNIARWDGVDWHALGSGLDGSGYVAFVFNGELIVGGSFTEAGGVPANNIARWNGSSWQPLMGQFGINGVSGGSVLALNEFNGELIVGGSFSGAGGIASPYIARWNGSCWRRMGSGFSDSVEDLEVHGGYIVAGGHFTATESARSLLRLAKLQCICEGDVNDDLAVDFSDYLEFLNWLDTSDRRADLNCDGSVDFGDFLEFINHYDNGC